MFWRLRRQLGSIALFILFLVSGAYGMPDNSASADHCLAAPTSTAPEGTHWFYRLDLRTTIKCWYLRVLGQSEQRIVARGRSTVASRLQLIDRRPAPTRGGAATSRTRISTRPESGTPPSPDLSPSAVKIQSTTTVTATTGDLERSGGQDARSPSAQEAMVQNSDTPQVDDQAVGPPRPVRVVWPIPISVVSPEVTETVAKNESVKHASSEAGPPMAGDTASDAVKPRERTTESLRIMPLTVFLFLSLGLPGASVIAWLVIRSDTARSEQRSLDLNETNDLSYDIKRLPALLDDQREPDWVENFHTERIQSPRMSLPPANALVARVPPSAEAIEAALRELALQHRSVLRYAFEGRTVPGSKREYEWAPRLLRGKTAAAQVSSGLAVAGSRTSRE